MENLNSCGFDLAAKQLASSFAFHIVAVVIAIALRSTLFPPDMWMRGRRTEMSRSNDLRTASYHYR